MVLVYLEILLLVEQGMEEFQKVMLLLVELVVVPVLFQPKELLVVMQ